MPHVTRLPAHRAITLLAAVGAIAGGCTVASPPRAASGTPPAVATAASSSSRAPSPAPPSPTTVSPSATPIASLEPAAVRLDRVLLVCEEWGEDPPSSVITCRDGAALALAAVGPDGSDAVRRLDVAYGPPCAPGGTCEGRRPDVVLVVARLRSGADGVAVRVARDPAGNLAAWPPTRLGLPAAAPFAPPPAVAPDLGADAPAAVRDRTPVPFCGDEDATGDRFDPRARRCFLDGVLAGSPVELVSRAASTEGEPILTLFRWTGPGSVEKSVRAGPGWGRAICAIAPVDTDARFVLEGGCDPLDS